MKHRLRRDILGMIVLTVARAVRIMPAVMARGMGAVFGRAAYTLAVRARKQAESNLARVFSGTASAEQRRGMAKQCFMNAGRNAFELLCLRKGAGVLEDIHIENEDVIKNALKKGKGAIIVSAHLGSWELLGARLVSAGYKVNVLARIIRHEPYNAFAEKIRTGLGMNVIYKTRVFRRALKGLRDNELLGVLVDQDIDNVNGMFLDFLGHPAYTPSGAAELSRMSGAPMIPCFIAFENGRHRIFTESAIEAPLGKEDIEGTMRDCNRAIEKFIRRFPEQWVWFHPRWKSSPGPAVRVAESAQATEHAQGIKRAQGMENDKDVLLAGGS